MTAAIQSPPAIAGPTVALVGLGVIGSYALPLLARQPGIAGLLLIDGDRYSAANRSQNMLPEDAGKPKSLVAARLAKNIRPDLRVHAIAERFEQVPLGKLRRATVICAAVDSRLSRRMIAEAAWRLRIPVVDAGVNSAQELIRLNTYLPGDDAACLQCAWGKRDYAAIADSFHCDGGIKDAPPTGASAQLGALAAAYQCIELSKMLAGDWANALVSRQLIVDARRGTHLLSGLHRSASCQFDHKAWRLERVAPLPAATATLGALVSAGRGLGWGGQPAASVSLPGRQFINEVGCECGERKSWLAITGAPAALPICERCGKPMSALAFFNTDRLDLQSPPAEFLDRPLIELGFRSGDWLRLARGGGGADETFIELPELGEESSWTTF